MPSQKTLLKSESINCDIQALLIEYLLISDTILSLPLLLYYFCEFTVDLSSSMLNGESRSSSSMLFYSYSNSCLLHPPCYIVI